MAFFFYIVHKCHLEAEEIVDDCEPEANVVGTNWARLL